MSIPERYSELQLLALDDCHQVGSCCNLEDTSNFQLEHSMVRSGIQWLLMCRSQDNHFACFYHVGTFTSHFLRLALSLFDLEKLQTLWGMSILFGMWHHKLTKKSAAKYQWFLVISHRKKLVGLVGFASKKAIIPAPFEPFINIWILRLSNVLSNYLCLYSLINQVPVISNLLLAVINIMVLFTSSTGITLDPY